MLWQQCVPLALSNLFCSRPQLRLSQDLSCFGGRMTFAWKGLHMPLESLTLNLESKLHNACDTQYINYSVRTLLSFFFFLAVLHGSVGYQFPDQGSNPCPLQWKHDCLNHWDTRKPLLSLSIARPLLTIQLQSGGPCLAVPISQHSARCLKQGLV